MPTSCWALPARYQQLNEQSIFHWLNNTYSLYGQDNWQVLPRLTLNLGIRWDGLPHVYEKNNRTSNFVPGDFNPADAQSPRSRHGQSESRRSGLQPAPRRARSVLSEWRPVGRRRRIPARPGEELTTEPWQPRVGFAYDLDRNSKTVVRGGYRIVLRTRTGQRYLRHGHEPAERLSAQCELDLLLESEYQQHNRANCCRSVLPWQFQQPGILLPIPGTNSSAWECSTK